MAQGQKNSSKNQSGKENRAYPRYPVALKAQFILPGKGAMEVMLRDYCIGGLFVELVETSAFIPEIGDVLKVVTSVENAGVEKKLSFDTKVMRVENNYIGVSFINPDILAVQAIHKFAASRKKQGVAETKEDFGTTQTDFNGKSAVQILTEAHQLVGNELKPLMDTFHSSISEHFFDAAKETFDLAKQNALFESLSILENNKNKITKSFITIYQNKIKNYSPQDILHEDTNEEEKEISLETLSLVESDELDNWLSISSIITNIDADNRDELNKIERRATALYQAKINKKNNPFGPALFAQAFQESLDDIEIQHAVKLVCNTAFRDVYLSIAEKLYQSINKFFIDNDVLPILKFKVERSDKKSSSSAADPADEPEQEFTENVPPGTQGQSAPASGKTDGHNTAAVQTFMPANRGMASDFSGDFSSQGRDFVKSMHQQPPVSGGAGGSSGIMDVFSDLRGLQQNLDQVHAGVPSDQLSAAPTTETLPDGGMAQHFSTTDLLDALSSQQLTGYDYATQSDSYQQDFKEKIQSILAAKGGTENKIISAREGQVIDVASNVFSSLMSDFQVAESIRPWIRQLEVPVLKMAIMDTDVFTDTSHVVRQVINKISELEVLASTDDADEQEAVKRAFDWLVKVINEDFDGTSKVFERIAQQLDILIKIQTQSFDKNLKVVVDEFLVEDKVVDAEIIENEEVVIDAEDEWACQSSGRR
jgi:predicted RNA binding protein with dsRBD fold (UPF0201 family)